VRKNDNGILTRPSRFRKDRGSPASKKTGMTLRHACLR
jgi:hypothetical protein